MQNGVIAELVDRNLGYIKRTGVKENLFFHSDALIGMSFAELKVGDKIMFKVTESKKGPYAVEVRKQT